MKSLLDNLKTLKVTELIDATKASYGKFGLSDDKALPPCSPKANGVALDLYFGDSGGRGQMTRIADEGEACTPSRATRATCTHAT